MNYIELNKAVYALDNTLNQNKSLKNIENIEELFFLKLKEENPTYHYLKGLYGKTFEGEKVLVINFEKDFHQLFYNNLNSLSFKIKEININDNIKKVLSIEIDQMVFIFINIPDLILEEYKLKKLIDVALHNKSNHCGHLFEFII
jgi:hypothetical protein